MATVNGRGTLREGGCSSVMTITDSPNVMMDGATRTSTSDGMPLMDEPIRDTIGRDLRQMSTKFQYVCSPKCWSENGGLLREWDLWGPLLLCIILSLSCWLKAAEDQKRIVFAFLFSFFWLGGLAVVTNVSLLGSQVNVFQGMGVLGYASFPLVACATLALLVPSILSFFKLLACAAGAYLSMRASISYIASEVGPERYHLSTYPVILYFGAIAWTALVI